MVDKHVTKQDRFVTGAWGSGATYVSAVCYKMQLAAIVRFTFVSRCASFLFMYISAWLAGLFSWARCSSMLSLGADSMWIIHYVSFVKVQSHGTKYVCFGWASYPVDVAFSSAVATTSDKHTNTHLSLSLTPTFPTPTIGSSLTLTRPWLTANSSEPRLHQHSLKRNEACVCVNRVLSWRKVEDKRCVRNVSKKVGWKSLELCEMLYHIGAGEPVSLEIRRLRRFVGFVSLSIRPSYLKLIRRWLR